MASRNPSRPMPEVKNQFRPVSDWIGHINDMSTCPYDSTHVVKAHKLMRHILKCEKRFHEKSKSESEHLEDRKGKWEKCPFNSLHQYPPENQEEHFRVCKARAAELMARIESGKMDINA